MGPSAHMTDRFAIILNLLTCPQSRVCRGVNHICHNRCLPLRVGCSVAEQDSSGPGVCSAHPGAHQCAGATSCAPGAQAFPAIPEGEAHACQATPHLNSLSHKPPEGPQIRTITAGVPGSSGMGNPRLTSLHAKFLPGESNQVADFLCCHKPLHLGSGSFIRGDTQNLRSLRQVRGGSFHLGDVPLPPLVLLDGKEQPS